MLFIGYFLFNEAEDSVIVNNIKQHIHILKENWLIQQEQVRKHYKLINLTRVETAVNCKLLRKLDQELIQLNINFPSLSRETIMLAYDKILFSLCYNCEGKFHCCEVV